MEGKKELPELNTKQKQKLNWKPGERLQAPDCQNKYRSIDKKEKNSELLCWIHNMLEIKRNAQTENLILINWF